MVDPAAFSPELRAFLVSLHEDARRELAAFASDPDRSTGGNPKGDVQRAFDVAIDEFIRRRLVGFFPSGVVLSEELADLRFGGEPPVLRFIVDPVDGSDNWRLGLPLSAVCLSAFSAEGPLAVDTQLWSLVGDLDRAPPLLAARGAGAWLGDQRLRVKTPRPLSDAYLTVQLNKQPENPRLTTLFSRARGARCYGSSAHDVALVARGAVDAHVDARGRVTAESCFAACLAVREAGGCVLGLDGRPLGPIERLTDRVGFVAASCEELAQEILAVLR